MALVALNRNKGVAYRHLRHRGGGIEAARNARKAIFAYNGVA